MHFLHMINCIIYFFHKKNVIKTINACKIELNSLLYIVVVDFHWNIRRNIRKIKEIA